MLTDTTRPQNQGFVLGDISYEFNYKHIYEEKGVICAMRLDKAATPDQIINLINRAVSNYVKENGEPKDALLVVSVSKIQDENERGRASTQSNGPPCHGII
jgi:hypothetical protein